MIFGALVMDCLWRLRNIALREGEKVINLEKNFKDLMVDGRKSIGFVLCSNPSEPFCKVLVGSPSKLSQN